MSEIEFEVKSIRRGKHFDRRNRLELYHDTICSIKKELEEGSNITYTKVQLSIGTSYDKMLEYIQDLSLYGLVDTNPLQVTPKGEIFLKKYQIVRDLAKNITADFFEMKEYSPNSIQKFL